MNQPISVGDLVMVVRDCCGRWIGAVFQVKTLHGTQNLYCEHCKLEIFEANAGSGAKEGSVCFAPLSWLRRIPPLWELDDVEHKESEPA